MKIQYLVLTISYDIVNLTLYHSVIFKTFERLAKTHVALKPNKETIWKHN